MQVIEKMNKESDNRKKQIVQLEMNNKILLDVLEKKEATLLEILSENEMMEKENSKLIEIKTELELEKKNLENDNIKEKDK